MFDKILNATPGRFQRTTKILLDHIKGSNKMNWDRAGRLVIDRAVVEGRNVLDLVHSVTRPRKIATPAGADVFLKTLAEINTPTELVHNAKSLKLPKVHTKGTPDLRSPYPRRTKLQKTPSKQREIQNLPLAAQDANYIFCCG